MKKIAITDDALEALDLHSETGLVATVGRNEDGNPIILLSEENLQALREESRSEESLSDTILRICQKVTRS